MKLTVTILACGLAAGLASAQNPSIIQNTRTTMNGVSSNATAASNNALGVQSSPVGTSSHRLPPAGAATVTPATASSTARKHKNMAKRAGIVTARGVVQVPKEDPAAHPTVAVTATKSKDAGAASDEQETAPNPKYAANGKRDPFVSPVVSHAGGSGCSVGKKCLEIGAIDLRGVVHSDNGFIAVVSNGLNKAYFLRENDPVFNGYVVKITGDSIVFQETLQDRLGKTFTREVVKKITTPAV
jgi:hypothetical protein